MSGSVSPLSSTPTPSTPLTPDEALAAAQSLLQASTDSIGPSLGDAFAAVLEASSKHKFNMYAQSAQDALNLLNSSFATLDVRQKYTALLAQAAGISTSYSALVAKQNTEIATLNAARSAYLNTVAATPPDTTISQLNAKTQALQTLIDGNKASQSDIDAYNAIISVYQSATASAAYATYANAITTYNAAVEANNADIASQNSMREQVQLPDIPTQQTVPIPTSPPTSLPSVTLQTQTLNQFLIMTSPSVPSISIPATESANNSALIASITTALLIELGFTTAQIVAAKDKVQEAVALGVDAENLVLPKSYIKRKQVASLSSAPGEGTGFSSVNIVTNVINSVPSAAALRLIAENLYRAMGLPPTIPVPDVLKQSVLFVILQAFSTTAQSGASSLSRVLPLPEDLATLLPSDQNTVVDVASALTLLNQTIKTASSADIKQQIADLVKNNPELKGLSQVDQEALIDALTAVAKLALLTAAISQLTRALKAPALLTQLLATVITPEQNPKSSLTINTVLNNTLSEAALEAALEETLTKQLIAEGVKASEKVAALVRRALDSVLAQRPFASTADLTAVVTDAFNKQGLKASQSRDLAKTVRDFVRTEMDLPVLNAPPPRLPRITPQSNDSIPAPYESVLANLQSTEQANVREAIRPVLNQSFETNRDRREALIKALTPVEGADNAEQLSNQLVMAVQSESSSAVDLTQNPLLTLGSNLATGMTSNPTDMLKNNLKELVLRTLEPLLSPLTKNVHPDLADMQSEDLAKAFSRRIDTALFGLNSIQSLLKEQIKTLQDSAVRDDYLKRTGVGSAVMDPSIVGALDQLVTILDTPSAHLHGLYRSVNTLVEGLLEAAAGTPITQHGIRTRRPTSSTEKISNPTERSQMA